MHNDEILAHYAEMGTLCRIKDWGGLDERFFTLTAGLAGQELAKRIQAVDLQAYTQALNAFFEEECLRLSHHAVRALYFEYDPTHLWWSSLSICDRYTRSSAGSDEWARHWIEQKPGPHLPAFAELYQQSGGMQPENHAALSVTLYLAARTTIAFAKAIDPVSTHKMALCIGHIGQPKITRVYE
jgi:hypothetical protein